VKVTPTQIEALRKIAAHVPGDQWPSRTLVERLEKRGLIEAEWRHTTTLGPFVHNATLTDDGRAALTTQEV
jgi:hypothetical protein